MVSVIIPIYNCEKYLNECISSVLEQTYKDFELILVDDGSTDNSLNICYEFAKKDSRIIVIHQDNGGVSSARNKGLKNAKGEFITFVDSDDYVENDWLKMLITAILTNNADVSVCGIKLDNQLRCLYENKLLTKDELLSELQKNGLLYSVFNKLYRREKLAAEFKNGLKFGEDLLFNLEYFRKINTIAVVAQALYFYRTDNVNSATTGFREDKFDNILYLYNQTSDFCKTIADERVRNEIQNRFAALHVWDYLGNMQRFIEKGCSTYKEDYIYFKAVLSKVESKFFSRKGFNVLLSYDKRIAVYFAGKGFINALLLFFKIKLLVKNMRDKIK